MRRARQLTRAVTRRIATPGVLLAGCLVVAPGAIAAPPVNDDYLTSYRLEDSQRRPPRQATLDVADTTEATVQADLFAPRKAGGGGEPTTCRGVSYGRTVWYDIIPDTFGVVKLQSAGRNGVIALYEYNPTTLRLGRQVTCANDAGVQDELDISLSKGKAYTVQLGGVDDGAGPAGGPVQFTMQFFEDRDHDGVIDSVDRCPKRTGIDDLNGCLPVVRASATMSLDGPLQAARLYKLAVTGDRGATVTASCGRCNIRAKRKLRGTKSHATASFSALRGRRVPNGSSMTVTVTRPGAIGQVFVWRVANGVPSARRDYCVLPGSTLRRRTCQ